MHDDGKGFLLRTTNVKDKFPDGNFSNSTDLTLAQLQTLSAGEWFLKVMIVLWFTLEHMFARRGLRVIMRRTTATWYYLTFQTDPYGTVSLLSEEEKERARNQTIPTLRELLQFAQRHNTPLMFDFKGDNEENDAYDTVQTILQQGIDPSLVSLLTCLNCDIRVFHDQAS